ncbi:MAG TPA: endonuclease [Phycisphaerae bacterium]|nr:endonuclease [Phycisphaerae bacterium]
MPKKRNRYEKIIERIFLSHYESGAEVVRFKRSEIAPAAKKLRIALPKNLGDVLYSFRFRSDFPVSVASSAPEGKNWMIRLMGKGEYAFVANALTKITPRTDLVTTKIPDATPGIIERYALSDEQALLAKLRYNRLVDVFAGITCYPLQSHLRTSVADMGQVETDEIYVGLDRKGAHYVIPVQAKGGRDQQSVVQIEQDMAICREKFPGLVCRPIAAQFMQDDIIAMFEFEAPRHEIAILAEKHYRLVPQEQLSPEELMTYQARVAST